MLSEDRLPLHPVRILEVPLGGLVSVRFLGPIRGLPTHHTKKGTMPCEGEGLCPQSNHRLPQVWKFYGACEYWIHSLAMWRPACIEATELLEESLRGRELRGEVWLLTREGQSKRHCRMVGTFCERLSDVALSPDFDIEPVLVRLFGVTNLLLGMPSPKPLRVMLSDVRAPGPRLPEELQPRKKVEDPKTVELFRQKLRQRMQLPALGQEGDQAAERGNGKGGDA